LEADAVRFDFAPSPTTPDGEVLVRQVQKPDRIGLFSFGGYDEEGCRDRSILEDHALGNIEDSPKTTCSDKLFASNDFDAYRSEQGSSRKTQHRPRLRRMCENVCDGERLGRDPAWMGSTQPSRGAMRKHLGVAHSPPKWRERNLSICLDSIGTMEWLTTKDRQVHFKNGSCQFGNVAELFLLIDKGNLNILSGIASLDASIEGRVEGQPK
jgi:hypothetical protein